MPKKIKRLLKILDKIRILVDCYALPLEWLCSLIEKKLWKELEK